MAVTLRAATLNHHDLWSLRGVGLPADRLPMVLGCDGAGVLDDGTEVVVHAVIGDPRLATATRRSIPAARSCRSCTTAPSPSESSCRSATSWPSRRSLSFEEAACLPTAYLTAHRMLTTRSGLSRTGHRARAGRRRRRRQRRDPPRQGAGSHRVLHVPRRRRSDAERSSWAPTRPWRPAPASRPSATWSSRRWGRPPGRTRSASLRPGGRVVVSGATSGPNPPADLNRVFFLQLSVVGSTMGTRDELVDLLALVERTSLHPVIEDVRPLAEARASFERLAGGDTFGKLVLTV